MISIPLSILKLCVMVYMYVSLCKRIDKIGKADNSGSK